MSKRASILILGLIVLGVFYRFVLTDYVLARGDTFTFFYPYWEVRHEALQAGTLPLWTNAHFMGAPLLAEPQLGIFYPFNLLLTPFSAPLAVELSILIHSFLAGAGVMVLFWSTVRSHVLGALTAGVVYAVGGAVTAHVEQVNQHQGLAWLGWQFWAFHRVMFAQTLRVRLQWGLFLAMLIALQFFSGHTQTVFIGAVGMGIYALLTLWHDWRKLIVSWASLAVGGIVAIVLVLPQFLPTLELTGMSTRGGGGFSPAQATAFSLPPHYLGLSLLPHYANSLFTEYIGTIGLVALGVGLFALFYAPLGRLRWTWAILAGAGVALALGRYNPLYYTVLAELPGFDLFRVPSRWLAWWGLGVAMLSGMGIIALEYKRPTRKQTLLIVGALGGISLITGLLPHLAPVFAPLPEEFTGVLSPFTALGWGIALGVLVWAFWRLRPLAVFVVIVGELWLASQVMPFNTLVPREVYESQRFTISQLLAYTQENPTARTLPISDLRFDVGDKATLRTRYERMTLTETAIQQAFTALKRQEMLFPNLSLSWGIPSVDGYGGGLLPSLAFSQFSALLLPPDRSRIVDGRLGEAFSEEGCRGACVPPVRWLSLMRVGYVVMDKIYDIWHENRSYDTGLHTPANQPYVWQDSAPLTADTLGVLTDGNPFDAVVLLNEDGTETALPLGERVALEGGLFLQTHTFPRQMRAWRIRTPEQADTHVYALTVSDSVTGNFAFLTRLPFERVLSSDIKIYGLPVLEALIPPQVVRLADTWQGREDALQLMQESQFDPTQTLILHDDTAPIAERVANGIYTADITHYSDTEIRVRVVAASPSYVLIADTYYPHWEARINGESVAVYRANVLFRAVAVPQGESEIVMTFEPILWGVAGVFGAVAWLIVGGWALILWRGRISGA